MRKYRLSMVLALIAVLTLSSVYAVLPSLRAKAQSYTMSISPNPASVPNDNTTTIQLTANVTGAGGPAVGVPVTFIIPAGLAAVGSTSGSTDASGNFVVTVKANGSTGNYNVSAYIPGDPNNTTASSTVSVTQAPVSGPNSSISASPTTVAANGQTSTITVTLRTAANQGVAGRTVTLTPNVGGVSVTPSSATTDGAGVAVFTVSYTNVSITSNTPVTFTTNVIDGVTLNTQVTFTPPAANAATSLISANPSSAPADGVTPVKVRVIVRDINGNTLPNRTVTLNVTPAGVSVSPQLNSGGAAGPTLADGIADFNLLSTTAGSFTVTATIEGNTTSGINITFTAAPVDPNNSTVTPATQSVVADNTSTGTITVTLRDIGGNLLANRAVTCTANPSSNVTLNGDLQTNASGVAVWTIRRGGGAAGIGTVAVTCTGGGVVLSGDVVQVAFTAAPPDKGQTTSAIAPSSIPGDGVTVSTVTITLRDAGGVPVPGVNVSLAQVTGLTGITISAPTVSDSNGVATFTVTAVKGTTGTATATFQATDTDHGIVFDTDRVNLNITEATVAVGPSTVVVTPDNIVVANGTDSATITVTAVDQGGHPLQGRSVTLSASSTTGIKVDGLAFGAWPTKNTDASGQVSFVVTSTTPYTPTGVTFTATVAGIALNETADKPVIEFTTPPADPAQSLVAVILPPSASTVPADNTTTATVRVTLRDAAGNPASGKMLSLSSSLAGVTVNGSPTTGTMATNSSGVADFLVKSSTVGTATFVINDMTDGINPFVPATGPNPIQVTFTASATGQVDGSKSTIDIQPALINVGQFGTITVVLRDASGAVIQGKSNAGSQFISSPPLPPDVVITPVISTSNAQGQLTWSITAASGSGGPYTLSYQIDSAFITTTPTGGNRTVTFSGVTPTPTNTLPPTFTPTAVPPLQQTQTAAAQQTNAAATLFAQQTANSAAQQTANAAASQTQVVLAPTQTAAQATVNFQNTNAAATQIVLNTQIAATKTILALSATPTAIPTTSATNSTVVCDFIQIPANGTTKATMTITLKDTLGNPVPNKAVSINISPATAGLIVVPTTGSTISNVAGVVQYSISGTTPTTPNPVTFAAVDVSSVPTVFIQQTCAIVFGPPNSTPIANAAVSTVSAANATGTAVALLSVPGGGQLTGTVAAWRLRVRTGPGLDYPIIGLLRYGTQVNIVGRNERGTWYLIQLQTGTAWVSAAWIRITRTQYRSIPVAGSAAGSAPLVPIPQPLIPREGEGIGVVRTFRLRVRVGPGLTYQQIGVVKLGTEVRILGRSPDLGWYNIEIQGGSAWVSAYYVRVKFINGNNLVIIQAPPRP